MRFNSYNVRPRYTPGSPASVNEAIALRVAAEERENYEVALSGMWGDAERARAEALGLAGIVYTLHEEGRGKRFRWVQIDLITGTTHRRLSDVTLRENGYLIWNELPPWAKVELERQGVTAGATRPSDLARRRWKLEATLVEYQPEELRGETA